MLRQRTAGAQPTSTQHTGCTASNLTVPSVPFQEWLLYRQPYGFDRDRTRLLLCQGAQCPCGRHFVNGPQNGGSEMYSSKKSAAKRVDSLRIPCGTRLFSRCPAHRLRQRQGFCQSSAASVERLLDGLGLPAAQTRLIETHHCLRDGGSL